MKVIDIINASSRTLSFEVFPPKTNDKFDSVREATEKIAALAPSFMSVTYGAGGSGSRFTLEIAANIQNKFSVPVIHHLTCVGMSEEEIDNRLTAMSVCGLNNILALRGDIPQGGEPSLWAYKHANELALHIKERGDFCIGGACYPDCHPEASSREEDIFYLKKKVEAGCAYLTTQLFFDNSVYYSFVENCRKASIDVPIIAGIMPITSVKQFERTALLSGSAIPESLLACAELFSEDPDGFRRAGMEFAKKQIASLYESGVKNIHVYTMNNPAVAAELSKEFGN